MQTNAPSFRTDLAMERTQVFSGSLPEGISQQEKTLGSLGIHTVHVTSSQGAQAIGKPQGRYVTISTPAFSGAQEIPEEEIEGIAGEISAFLPPKGLVLVVGLGNNDITPDAIGPRTAHQILATRHFSPEAAAQAGLGRLRPVAAIAPGVLGQTGIETSEIIHSITGDIRPAAVIVIDALAARDVSRLGSTIQISDSGIAPGSGVQNRRKELSSATLDTPVVSIGIPTVVDAATLVSDLLGEDELKESQKQLLKKNSAMMITPREIDVLISHACKTLALAINKAVQPDLSLEEIGYLVS